MTTIGIIGCVSFLIAAGYLNVKLQEKGGKGLSTTSAFANYFRKK